MSKYKVGDRVHVYGCNWCTDVEPMTIINIIDKENIRVTDVQNTVEKIAHAKQCRLIKKSKKRKLYAVIPSYTVSSVIAFCNEEDAKSKLNSIDPCGSVQVFVEEKKN